MGDKFAAVIAEGVESGAFETGGLSEEACVAAILATLQGYFTLAALDRALIPAGSAAPATRRMVRGLLEG